MDPNRVPVLSLTVSNFNPNHKCRFVLLTPSLRWLADLAFAGSDDSIYVAPRLQQPYTLAGRGSSGTQFQVVVDPPQDLHLSLHHSGTVNLTVGAQRFEIRRERPEAFHGQLFTLGIKNPDVLQPATENEINSLPGRHTLLPVAGFLHVGPVYLTIYRVPVSKPWEMPKLSDTLQLHFECLVSRKDVKYEFVVWQNSNLPAWSGDVAVAIHGAA